MKEEVISYSPAETKRIGEKTARKILRGCRKKRAKVISLEGELGGGKTTFLKGFARGLGVKEVIKSPSFVIMKKYRLPITHYLLPVIYFYHFDCYRVENPEEILRLGWEEIIKKPQNIIAVEWGEKIRKVLPQMYFWITFEFINKTTRKITFLEISTKNIEF